MGKWKQPLVEGKALRFKTHVLSCCHTLEVYRGANHLEHRQVLRNVTEDNLTVGKIAMETGMLIKVNVRQFPV